MPMKTENDSGTNYKRVNTVLYKKFFEWLRGI